VEDFSRALPLLHESTRDHIQEFYRGRGFCNYHLARYDEAITDLSLAIAHTETDRLAILHHLYNTLGHACLHKSDLMGRQLLSSSSMSEKIGYGNSLAVRALKDIIRSHTALYRIARRARTLVRRVVRQFSG
jgi:hypothetical protein